MELSKREYDGKRTCREGSDALTIHAIGEIHELTMAFTATAILQLVEQGMITLNQRAADILHEFDDPYFRTITIFHLLTHTSGLIPNPNVFAEAYPFPHIEWQTTFKGHWLQGILSFPLVNKPGEQHAISNAGYAVLGLIIEKVTNKRFEVVIPGEYP